MTGTLTLETFLGPPNYGEDTITDKKEQEYVLNLEKPINIIAPTEDISGGFNEAKTGIKKLQLIPNEKLGQYVNKKIKVSGKLFGTQTGHHHTEVLLSVIKMEQQ